MATHAKTVEAGREPFSVLAINSGSSSLRFTLFKAGESLAQILTGKFERIGLPDAGVPVNVTLLFSREHYLAAAEACLRGIERRIEAGLNPLVGSVASVFISRWDVAVVGRIPEALNNRLGIAIAGRIYKAHLNLAHLKPRLLGHWGTTPGPPILHLNGYPIAKPTDLLHLTVDPSSPH